MQQNEGRGPSWAVIVIMFIVFWPVGLYLLIKKEPSNPAKAKGNGKGMIVTAIVFYSLVAIVLLGCIDAGFESGDLTALIFLGSIGVIFHVLGIQKKNMIKKMKQYTEIIVNGGVRSLDQIASATGKSYDVVRTDVQYLIHKDVIRNAYIDENLREVVVTKDNVNPYVGANNYSYVSHNVDRQNTTTRVVKCPGCGANNTITGAGGECEYCGSPLV